MGVGCSNFQQTQFWFSSSACILYQTVGLPHLTAFCFWPGMQTTDELRRPNEHLFSNLSTTSDYFLYSEATFFSHVGLSWP